MPSARMGEDGEIGFGYASVPPYGYGTSVANLLIELKSPATTCIFKGVDDPVLSQTGFGDFSDKGLT